MTTAQVRKLYEARPFRPFEVRMADGRAIRVDHPEFMSFSPSGRTIVVNYKDADEDNFEIIDLLLATALQFASNGTTKRRA